MSSLRFGPGRRRRAAVPDRPKKARARTFASEPPAEGRPPAAALPCPPVQPSASSLPSPLLTLFNPFSSEDALPLRPQQRLARVPLRASPACSPLCSSLAAGAREGRARRGMTGLTFRCSLASLPSLVASTSLDGTLAARSDLLARPDRSPLACRSAVMLARSPVAGHGHGLQLGHGPGRAHLGLCLGQERACESRRRRWSQKLDRKGTGAQGECRRGGLLAGGDAGRGEKGGGRQGGLG